MYVNIIDELNEMLRPENGWTQKSLAEKFGISPQYLGDILHGNRFPGKKLLDAMGIERVVIYKYKDETFDD